MVKAVKETSLRKNFKYKRTITILLISLFILTLFNQTMISMISTLFYHFIVNILDPFLSMTWRGNTFKQQLIQNTQFNKNATLNLLEIGCGPGAFTLQLKLLFPQAKITGIDMDKMMLPIAQRYARSNGFLEDAIVIQDFDELSRFEDQSFDGVVSTLFFHHLDPQQKVKTLEEVIRILKPNGELHIADFGIATHWLMRWLYLIVQVTHGFQATQGNVEGEVLECLERTGFKEVNEMTYFYTIYGNLTLYKAIK